MILGTLIIGLALGAGYTYWLYLPAIRAARRMWEQETAEGLAEEWER